MRCLRPLALLSPAVLRAHCTRASLLVAILAFVAGLSAPTSCVQATVTLSGWGVGQSGPVSSGQPALQTDPVTQAAADLPVHDATVGSLAGEARVDGGAGVYSVPIVVPPGRAGMQPALSLNYSSRGGDGVMGMGWSIGGVSSIHRCPQTPEQDGQALGVSYTNTDRLCLDGQRLVAVSGSYGTQNAEYRTEIDSFARITQLGGDLSSGGLNTTAFKVEWKSGRISTYGSTTGSRMRPAGAAAAQSWLVDKVQDRVGNFEAYSYTDYGSGELLLSAITYTGFGGTAGDRVVAFTYVDRTTAAAGVTDINSSYLAGGLTLQTKALSLVATKVGGINVRTITPSYAKSNYTGRLILTGLTECAADAAGTCLPANKHPMTHFVSADGALDFRPADLSTLLGAGADSGANGPTSSVTQVQAFGDLDGDGTREMLLGVTASGGSTSAKLAQLTGDRQAHTAVDASALNVPCVTGGCTGDFLGSGRTSILKGPASAGDPQFVQIGSWHPGRGHVALAGETLMDWVVTDIPYAYFVGVPAVSGYPYDFNGDGRLDIGLLRDNTCAGGYPGLYVYIDTGTTVAGKRHYLAATSGGGALVCMNSSTEAIDHIADLNGDGLPDTVLRTVSLSGDFSRAVFTQRTGTTLATTSKTCSDMGLLGDNSAQDDCHWNDKRAVVHWIDVNGDGLEDFVIATTGAGSWQVRLNNGGHFGTKINTGSSAGLQLSGNGSFRYAGALPPMDIDADGKPELLLVSASRGFAIKMCSVGTVNANAQGECPDGAVAPVQSDGTTSSQQCAVYACPEDPDLSKSGEGLPPRNVGIGGNYGTYGGRLFYGMYAHDLGGNDTSTYHLSALKFVQAANGTISAQEIQTEIISEVGQTLRTVDDLFGDGMTDLVTPMGCTRHSIDVTIPGNPPSTVTYPGCLLMDDATYGVASIELYPSLTANASVPVATSTFTNGYKTFINQNYGANSTPSLALTQAKAVANKSLKVADAAPLPQPVLPDLLAMVTNGVGDTAVWVYAPLSFPASQDDILLYDLPQDDGYTDDRHFYFTSSMPVVSGFVQSNGVGDFVGFRSAVYGYGQAMYNHYGRGFQGFRTITSETAVDNTVPAEWDRRVRTTTTFHQKFPLTGEVESVLVSKQNTSTLISSQTPTWRCATRTSTNYPAVLNRTTSARCPGDTGATATVAANTIYFPFLDSSTSLSYDPGNGAQVAQTDTDNSANATDSAWDNAGNLGKQVVTVKDINSPDLDSHVTTTTHLYVVDFTNWWLDKLTSSTVGKAVTYNATNHVSPIGLLPSQSVTNTYVWNSPDRTLASQTVQASTPDQEAVTSYTYPSPSYGLPTQVTVTQTGLSSSPELSPTRTTHFTYTKNGSTAAADGYFVLDTTHDLAGVNPKTTTTWEIRDGQVLTSTDPNLVKTSTTYDRFGRATQVVTTDKNGAAIGSPIQSAWTNCASNGCSGLVGEDSNEANAAWRVTSVHPGFPVQVSWFDVLGRAIKQGSGSFDGTIVATLALYDRLGTVATASTPYKIGDAPALPKTTYDLLNRPVTKELTGSSLDSTNGNEVREYAYAGRTTTVTVRAKNKILVNGNCPSGSLNLCFKVTRRVNALGQLMNTTDAGNGSTNFWHDANGPLVAMTDAQGNLSSAVYDALGRRTQNSDPDQGTSTYAYDALGELRTQTDARGVLTSVTGRDTLGRMTARTVTPPGVVPTGLSPLAFLDTWSYDPANAIGQLDTATRQRGFAPSYATVWQESTTYDVASRPITLSTTITEGSPTSLGYLQDYDLYGRPQTVTYPSTLPVKTDYATYGQTSALSNAVTHSTYWIATAADAWGHITEDSANGVDGHYVYDAATGQSTSRIWAQSGITTTSLAYTYDSFANLTQQTRDGHVETYTYDARQRLTQTLRGPIAVNYGYTAAGNISKKSDYSTDTAGAYAYATANGRTNGCGPHAVNSVSLSAGGTATFTCDANGNVIGGSTLTAMYSTDDHPIQIQRASVGGTPDPSCATAAADRLFCSGFQTFTPGTGGGTATWAYASDGSKVYEASSLGTVLFGHYGYEKVGSVHRHQLGPVVVSRTGATDTVTAVLADRLGSTVGTVDTTTTLRAFDAFGAVRNGDLSNKPDGKLALPATLHGFTQHEQVDDVRLIHMGGRVFDPALGRFLNVDPVIQNAANSQALNPYSYVLNNPLSGTDPTGYQSSCTGSHIDRDDGGSCDEQGVSGGSTHLDNREMAKALGARVVNGFAAMWNARAAGGNGNDSQGPKGPASDPSSGAAVDIGVASKANVSQGTPGFAATAVDKIERFFAPNWVEVGERGEPGGWTDWASGSLKETGNIVLGSSTDLNPATNILSHIGFLQRYSFSLSDKEVLPAAVLDSAIAIGGAIFGPKGSPADTPRALPNSALVARGGNAANQSAARINAAIGPSRTPGISGFSAQCNGGICLSELGKFIPNKQLGVTTVGEIRAIGGDVVATPGFGNHVTVNGVTGEAMSPLFRVVPNPNPLVIP